MAIAAVAAGYHLRWIGDDAFISFRYAKNLVDGHGLVFNLGERVEGYTNFLWTILVAIGLALRFDPILWACLWSLASFAGVVVVTQKVTEEVRGRESRPLVSVSAVFLPMSYLMANFATSGLETMFAAFLSLSMLLAALRAKPLLAGFLGVLSAMSHPDHILLYGAMALALAWPAPLVEWRAQLRSRDYRRKVLRFGAPFFGVFLPYYLGRFWYYGDFFPNTYYAKSGGLFYFQQGGVYLLVSVFAAGLLVATPLAYWGALRLRSTLAGRYFLVAIPLFAVYAAKIGGDFMLGRILVSAIPLVLLFAELQAEQLLRARRSGSRAVGWLAVAGLALVALPIRVVRDGEKFWHVSDERTFYPLKELGVDGVVSHYRQRATDLRKHVLAHGYEPVLGAGNVGVVGFFSGVRIVDILALVDRTMAHMPITLRSRPGHEKIARGPYLVERQVDLSDDPIFPEPFSKWTEGKVGSTPYFLTGYKPKLLEAVRRDRAVRFPDIESKIAARLQDSTDRSIDEVGCEAWFFDLYYFKHRPSSKFVQPYAAALARVAGFSDPADGTLFLRSTSTDGYRRRTIFSFDDVDGFEVEGLAFQTAPTRGWVPDQGFVHGVQGGYLNSFAPRVADAVEGSILSREFLVDDDFLTVDVGGGRMGVAVELVSDGRVVRSASGCDAEMLGRKVWDVTELRGSRARLRVRDGSVRGWGHVLVDELAGWSRR